MGVGTYSFTSGPLPDFISAPVARLNCQGPGKRKRYADSACLETRAIMHGTEDHQVATFQQ